MRLAWLGAVLLTAIACQRGPGDIRVIGDATDVDAAIVPPGDGPAVDAVLDEPTDASLDAGPVPFVPFVPPQPLPPGTCAPPVGEWTGLASIYERGTSGNHVTVAATVAWRLASTDGCVDHYRPEGMVQMERGDACCHGVPGDGIAPIAAGDGELIVDRSTSPPTYRMSGATRWSPPTTCAPDSFLCEWSSSELGGAWAYPHEGEIDGDAFGGVYDEPPWHVYWRFTRIDASLPPAEPCSEPPVERWAGTMSRAWVSAPFAGLKARAELDWRRVETVGCRDLFRPSGGTAYLELDPGPDCVERTVTPDHAPVGASDGSMTIDRALPTPAVMMLGGTTWSAEVRCVHVDGSVTSESTEVRAAWGEQTGGYYVGDRFAGGTTIAGQLRYTWAAQTL